MMNRIVLLSTLVVLAACGGAHPQVKPANDASTTAAPEAADEAAVESSEGQGQTPEAPQSVTTLRGSTVDDGTDAPRNSTALAGAMLPSKPRVGDGVDVDDVRRVVRKHRMRLRRCYSDVLESTPEYTGRVTTLFAVAADGSTREISATAEPNHQDLSDCFVRHFTEFQFAPPSEGDTNVEQSFSLSPRK